ncbi:MAG: hypothetical protein ACKOCH_22540, partial [Bacteroidota bacterium]
ISFLEVKGGTGPYSYSIDGGETFIQKVVFEGITPGTYSLFIQDANGCEHRENIVVPQSPATSPSIAKPAPPLPSALGNLPRPLTSFIGRGPALAEVRRLITQLDPDSGLPIHPLVTIVGQGGSGKTRLAIQVARELAAQYLHGAWWVELAPLNDGAL